MLLVTWPLNGSDAGVDFVLIQTSLLFVCTSLRSFTYEKHDVCIKTKSSVASSPHKGQVTKNRTVKWPIKLVCK